MRDPGSNRCPTMTLSIKNKKTQVYLSNLIEQLILFHVFMSQKKKTQVYLFPFEEHQLSIISFNVIYHMSQKSSQHQLVPGAVLILM